MSELVRLASEYYKNTVGWMYFGKKGWVCIMGSLPFAVISFYISLPLGHEYFGLLPLIVAATLWIIAKNEWLGRAKRAESPAKESV